ncbi:MAG: hypothetical protein J6U19_02855 [Oscillospiraceae bacterium]|nr:hypothetical protein [Oscillospiraceae bacterium]
MLSVSVLILATALFLAMVMNLALKSKYSSKITTACMVIGIVGGIIFYGVGFAETTGNLVLSILRTPFCVIRMFIGINELSAIQESSLVSTEFGITVFWFVHLCAFYSITSAVLTTIGAAAVRQLRLMLSRRGELTMIYGINERSRAIARECLSDHGMSVVFIAEQATESTIGELNDIGASVLVGAAAAASEDQVIKKLHAKNRTVTVYALDDDPDRDLQYALRLRDALKRAEVPPENTRLTLPGTEDIIASMLQVSENQYGFGYVNVYNPAELTARALIRTCPPWDQISFWEDGHAKEDFSCVIVGFGSHGQEVLKQLVMNSQFAGSSFHAAVFSLRSNLEAGYLLTDCPELQKQYDITGMQGDGRGREFYEYIEEHLSTLKLIAICTGSDSMNREISDNLMLFLHRRHAENVCVVQCGANGVRYQAAVGSPIISTKIYTRAFLSAEEADRDAILLNSTYDTSERSDWEKWVSCDSFSKMSSRASAEFLPAFVRISGSSKEAMLNGEWTPSPEMQQVLGETEHLRWCAFHYAMGYTPMTPEQFQANAETWAQLQKEGSSKKIKIAKDAQARRHACLIPWSDLDDLSARENQMTGRNVDYKQLDINNVLALPHLLQVREEAMKKKAGI